jgi:hypothetical protein
VRQFNQQSNNLERVPRGPIQEEEEQAEEGDHGRGNKEEKKASGGHGASHD